MASILSCGSALGACSNDGETTMPTDRDRTSEALEAKGVGLEVSAVIAERPQYGPDEPELVTAPAGRGLLLTYRVTNTGATPVVIVDRIPGRHGSASGPSDQIDPLKVFVLPDDPDPGTATIAKRGFEQDGADLTVRFQGTVADVGATVEGRAFAPLPLGAGDGATTASPSPDEGANRWRFCVGVVPLLTPDVLPGGKHAMVPTNTAQSFACTDVSDLPTA